MTLDAPDWSAYAFGSLRYLGELTCTNSVPVTQSFAIQPNDRSLYVMSDVSLSEQAQAWAVGDTSGITTPFALFGSWPPFAGTSPGALPVSASLDPTATVHWLVNTPVITRHLWVFASTDPPPVVNIGQGVTATVAFGTIQPVNAMPSVPPSFAQGNSEPAAGAQATLTIAGVVGQKVMVDEAVFRLLSRGTADILNASMSSAGAGTRQRRCQVTATTGNTDELAMHGYLGASGANVVVQFTGAPAAGNFEVIDAAWHYVDAVTGQAV